jgi:hypothetical protein
VDKGTFTAPGAVRSLWTGNIMSANPTNLENQAPVAFRFYHDALAVLRAADVPFLVGGAYAFACYTGIARHTKDLDIFVRPPDARRALQALQRAGYRTELTFPHWLGKAHHGGDFLDVIFSSGNGLCTVDEGWFEHAVEGEVLGEPARLVPVEEMIWQKSYIMERERFDGADVLHLLRARGATLDWGRLLARFGPHWRILLSNLVLFGFVYPEEKDAIPPAVLSTLVDRLADRAVANGRLCQGTLLSRMQYLPDTAEWGYHDARLLPGGKMSPEQIESWTAAGK